MRGLQHAEDVAEGRPWRRDHPFVGERARRYFPVPGVDGGRIAPYDGKIDGWLPPEADDPPLWHLQMADGDDEVRIRVRVRVGLGRTATTRSATRTLALTLALTLTLTLALTLTLTLTL